ncbi:MAG: anaerobic sulfatase maturase [candidate division WS1 bacterium]|nr:anaerobic sulfatase maturase [candidate division WS1 bacterium]
MTVLIKPAGPDCNLACSYCFYSDRNALYPDTPRHRMSDETLRELVRKYMNYHDRVVPFAWQGGEPTLMGLDFFKRAVSYQRLYGRSGQTVSNSLQTNAVLLDDPAWARFLHDYHFLVGVSLDGPAEVHDAFRVDHAGKGSHSRVVAAIETLLEHEVEVNILSMVQPENIHRPTETYEYLLSLGVDFLQFIPLAEPAGDGGLMDFSISPRDYGHFLCELFDLWAAAKPREAYVRMFDDALAVVMGYPHPTCMFGEHCGPYFVVEHNGDIYACDFFVEEQWKYGNIHDVQFHHIPRMELYKTFRARKTKGLDECARCQWFSMCHGGCPKYRVMLGDAAQPTYFCEAYRMFFEHSYDTLQSMARKLHARRQAEEQAVKPKDPCPCGSGRRYCDCCMP